MTQSSLFISTTIPYVNSSPHVGFAFELAQADAYARYRRLKGASVFAQTGTDENSLKNVLAAEARGVSPRAHVDENAESFRDLALKLGTSFDKFLRTSSDEHRLTVEDFWKRLDPRDLYRGTYTGHYCIGCEEFLNITDLPQGRCLDHGTEPELLREENIFFRLSNYQDKLRELIESDRLRIRPASRKNEILSFLGTGLRDISITRDRARSGGWGIPVPGDDHLVIYVWIDALINYLGNEAWSRSAERLHFIGKNVWKFHALYWPALLLSAGLPLPSEIIVHGFLTVDGRKISKSAGPTIDPRELIARFGADSLRFYLLRTFSTFDDGDFSERGLSETHNSYLVNGFGNLLSRLTTLAERFEAPRPAPSQGPTPISGFETAIESFRFDEALRAIWREIDRLNAEIAADKPWELLKGDRTQGRQKISQWLRELSAINYWLSPFLPEACEEAARQIHDVQASRRHLFERKEIP